MCTITRNAQQFFEVFLKIKIETTENPSSTEKERIYFQLVEKPLLIKKNSSLKLNLLKLLTRKVRSVKVIQKSKKNVSKKKKQISLISLFDIKGGELSNSLRRKYQKQVD